jgi:hypothetical protein
MQSEDVRVGAVSWRRSGGGGAWSVYMCEGGGEDHAFAGGENFILQPVAVEIRRDWKVLDCCRNRK